MATKKGSEKGPGKESREEGSTEKEVVQRQKATH